MEGFGKSFDVIDLLDSGVADDMCWFTRRREGQSSLVGEMFPEYSFPDRGSFDQKSVGNFAYIFCALFASTVRQAGLTSRVSKARDGLSRAQCFLIREFLIIYRIWLLLCWSLAPSGWFC